MSDPISALGEAAFDGLAQVREAGLQGMITLRGDPADAGVAAAARAATGLDLPARGTVNLSDTHGLAWMSPDEMLVMCPHARVGETLAAMRQALSGVHALAVDVSDARAVFDVTGPRAREVMAKLTPADVAPGAFGPGRFRRSRLAQVPAAFWMPREDAFRIVCFRSVAAYMFDLLCTASAPGAEVDAW